MKTIQLVLLTLLFSALARGSDPDVPMGTLGLPYGTFAVIIGTYIAPTPPKKTAKMFRVEAVNGTVVEKPFVISLIFSWSPDNMKDGAHYVLHGLEQAMWGGSPPVPAGESASLDEDWRKEPPVGPFGLGTYFRPTSIEKENGVLAPDARPLPPGYKLAEPHFPVPPGKTPIGVLGLPLGTYVHITVGAPRGPVDGIVCEVLEVNGKPVKHRTTIAVPFFGVPSGKETEVLHGFESGTWRFGLTPDWEWKPRPRTSDVTAGVVTSGGSRFEPGPPRKVEFDRYFTLTNWDKRISQDPERP